MAAKKAKKKSGGARRRNGLRAGTGVDLKALQKALRDVLPEFAGIFDSDSESAIEAAQEIIYQASEEPNPTRRLALVRKALEISPDCADAYSMLAESAPTIAEKLELFQQAVWAGERALGEKAFTEFAGHFWGVLQTRPYMRAKEALANYLWLDGQREESLVHCREMLRLNPNDNQGIRSHLAYMLLAMKKHDELAQLLEAYSSDESTELAYCRALLAFRNEGNSAAARELLLHANNINHHVPDFLTRRKPAPMQQPRMFSPGDKDEAVNYVLESFGVWNETPGAVDWLSQTLQLPPAQSPREKAPPWSRIWPLLDQLPQYSEEEWEIDLKPFGGEEGKLEKSIWMLAVVEKSSGEAVQFEFLPELPKDGEVFQMLIKAFNSPVEGEPRLPGILHVARKSWLRSWRNKLKNIRVKCMFRESLETFDRWYDTASEKMVNSLQVALAPPPSEEDWSALGSLPQQAGEIWEAAARRSSGWAEDPDDEDCDPCFGMVASLDDQRILASQICPPGDLGVVLCKSVWQAITSPLAGQPHRPGVIRVGSQQQRKLLAPLLEPIDICCVADGQLQIVEDLIDDASSFSEADQAPCGLVRAPGVTSAQLESLFEAAAAFYLARPWRNIPGDTIIELKADRFSSPWYCVVMGQSGIERGCAFYEDGATLKKIIKGNLSEEACGRMTSALSLIFGSEDFLTPEDLKAARKHRWPIAGSEAYPMVMRVKPGPSLRTPLKWELELLEGGLRAIELFVLQSEKSKEIPVRVFGELVTFQVTRLPDFGK